jgi:hypothetical protein
MRITTGKRLILCFTNAIANRMAVRIDWSHRAHQGDQSAREKQ